MTQTSIKILFYTFNENGIQILSLKDQTLEIPSLNINSLDGSKTIVGMNHLLKKIHNQHTSISFEWARYKFIDIELYQELQSNAIAIDIYYAVFLPSQNSNRSGYWLNVTDFILSYPILRKMSYHV